MPPPASRQPDPELLGRAVGYALSLCHDLARAEELVQETCLAVLRAEGPWEPGYVFRAIRSRWIDQHRRSRRLELVPLGEDDDVAAREGPLAHVPALPVSEPALERALGELPDEQRELLYLSVVEGYSEGELARLTGRPKGTISSVLHRTRRQLRKLLTPKEALS